MCIPKARSTIDLRQSSVWGLGRVVRSREPSPHGAIGGPWRPRHGPRGTLNGDSTPRLPEPATGLLGVCFSVAQMASNMRMSKSAFMHACDCTIGRYFLGSRYMQRVVTHVVVRNA